MGGDINLRKELVTTKAELLPIVEYQMAEHQGNPETGSLALMEVQALKQRLDEVFPQSIGRLEKEQTANSSRMDNIVAELQEL
ncbi:hypothetical protein VTP01DRAFT_2936 [Rhizomucor pusillus]|uniref:uncharacterized protein n=1 Tax=Rhizomucor pusillus TaxID=4840 RepID=UPI003742AAC6